MSCVVCLSASVTASLAFMTASSLYISTKQCMSVYRSLNSMNCTYVALVLCALEDPSPRAADDLNSSSRYDGACASMFRFDSNNAARNSFLSLGERIVNTFDTDYFCRATEKGSSLTPLLWESECPAGHMPPFCVPPIRCHPQMSPKSADQLDRHEIHQQSYFWCPHQITV